MYKRQSLYDIDTEIIKNTLANFELNNGRLEHLKINNIDTTINLAKNPTGANVSLRILNEDVYKRQVVFYQITDPAKAVYEIQSLKKGIEYLAITTIPVSYTHLDVYKRQTLYLNVGK